MVSGMLWMKGAVMGEDSGWWRGLEADCDGLLVGLLGWMGSGMVLFQEIQRTDCPSAG